MINGEKIPMPFNFQSIDIIYDEEEACRLKQDLIQYYGEETESVTVFELLNAKVESIVQYGQYMFENEYQLYTAKQWGREIDSINPEIFKRVPVYLSYKNTYQKQKFQFYPIGGFTKMSESIVNHENIKVIYGMDVLENGILQVENNIARIELDGEKIQCPVLFSGELDALFKYEYGELPYRSLEFLWKTYHELEYQDTTIVAYPQAEKITRVTEYKKLPMQKTNEKITVISLEIPMEYNRNSPCGNVPYYPIQTEESEERYLRYKKKADGIDNLFLCGRLAEYRYFNMDMVIRRAWVVAEELLTKMTN